MLLSREMAVGPPVPRLDMLLAVSQEARAFAQLARLMWRDIPASTPERMDDGDQLVVLVHGSMATAGAWRPLRRRLEALGRTHTATFSYGPMNGVSEIANSIGDLLRRLPGNVRIHLVGHSLGGLAVRWFVQETRSDPRVVQTITVAAPFRGARGAFLMPGPAGRDMRQGSVVLGQLARSAHEPGIANLSILGSADTAVSPDSFFPLGDRVIVPNAAHNTLLFHDQVATHVVNRVARESGVSAAAAAPIR